MEDRVPHVERIDGLDMWVVDGSTFGRAGSGGTIDHEGAKHPWVDSQGIDRFSTLLLEC